jgi:hypothetical protein
MWWWLLRLIVIVWSRVHVKILGSNYFGHGILVVLCSVVAVVVVVLAYCYSVM